MTVENKQLIPGNLTENVEFFIEALILFIVH